MRFTDIFRKSFLEAYENNISIENIFFSFLVSILIGIFIYSIYRYMSRKAFYSKNFNISLVILTLITTAIIITIQTSVVVSLGMVGALSIVRFRTAVKEPLDLVFLFWSISVGIIIGAGQYIVAIILSLLIVVILSLLQLFPTIREPKYVLVNIMGYNEEVNNIIKKYTTYHSLKSQTIKNEFYNLLYEIKGKRNAEYSIMLKEIASIDNVESVSLVSQDGEVTV